METYAEVHGATESNWRVVAEDPGPFLALGVADAAWLEAELPWAARALGLPPLTSEGKV